MTEGFGYIALLTNQVILLYESEGDKSEESAVEFKRAHRANP
jgi:hypothetical protein